ncbi:tyrosinase family protein [Micromonospora sp. CPCC 206061]|uniref:tyrosinase family protein n=1 Tax=Micromonospora sp. CPCC 206061 TaxID=3122410 RepID=UPI002FF2D517
MRCRKNVKDLTPTEMAEFIAAINGLKARDSVLHPGAQSRYDDYVEIHRSAMDEAQISPTGTVLNPGWGHFDSAFFPWHRELLYRFEEDLRSIRPNVTIPYWDWTRAQSAGSVGWPFIHAFIGVDGTDASGDRVLRQSGAATPYPHPFDPEAWSIVVTDTPTEPRVFRRAFAERTDAPALPQNNTVVTGTGTSFRQALTSAAYTTLRARSEDLHNLVHRWAGGNMITASSPNDPVFWMHHAQIDRMWTLWQDINPALPKYVHNNGFAGHGPNDTLIYARPGDPAPWVGTATPNQLLNGHAIHGTSVWYQSDRPEISLATGSALDFGNVPQGLTQYRAVRFDIRTCRQVRFRVTAPPTGNFGLTPSGPQLIVEPDLVADSVTGLVWFQFAANGPASQTSSATIEAFLIDPEGYYAPTEGGEVILGTWTISLTAAVTPRDENTVVLVLDRSGSMIAPAGGTSTRTGLLKEAVSVFHSLLRPSDEIGVVSFDDVTEILLPLTTQSTGLGTTLTGPGLDPRNLTGIGLGMQDGATLLAGASHPNRSLVVLTDGNQNVHPFVEELPAGTITSRTYAVGFGLPGQVSDETLLAIAHNTRGSFVVTGLLGSAQERYLLTKYFVQILAGVTAADVILDPQNLLLIGSEDVTPFHVTEADVSIDVIILTPMSPFVEVLVRTPDGTEIDPAMAAAEPNIDYQLQPYVAFYRIDLPALPASPDGSHAGTWHIITRVRREEEIRRLLAQREDLLDAEALALLHQTKKLPYSTVVHTRSNLRFDVLTKQDSAAPGAQVSLVAHLREYDVPFGGNARVGADLTQPDGTTAVLSLSDQGSGTYDATFVASDAGIYTARVRAEGVTTYGSYFTRESVHTAGTFVGRPSTNEEEPRPKDVDRDRLRGMAADQPAPDEWRLDDLVERRRDPEITWPSAQERADAAARAERMRLEMTGHDDPGWMMFPSIADDGRVIPTSPADAHGPGHGHTDEHHDGDEREAEEHDHGGGRD